jgi:hypothetical protein
MTRNKAGLGRGFKVGVAIGGFASLIWVVAIVWGAARLLGLA